MAGIELLALERSLSTPCPAADAGTNIKGK
ncbi:hypothetical protein P308_14570 [Pseudomonas piscis]|nr:hypothetical protein P308_14670 [Pseudomonas piscis]ERO60345.1 hypothetical protein P308_14570 [Pseudomonas piscis]